MILFIAGMRLSLAQSIPGTNPLTLDGDLSAQMIQGIDRFLLREIDRSATERGKFWKSDLAGDGAAYEKSVAPNRARLARMIGVVDPRPAEIDVEFVSTVSVPALVAETDRFAVYSVRWPAIEGLYAEGLLLQPKGAVSARVVALPDADQTPEQIVGLAPGLPPLLQYARRLAENGCQVLVPGLLDRTDAFSGNAAIKVFTNHPHREWIYRQSFVLGRHVIGYEVQKVLAAVDWFERLNRESKADIGVVGWGEGALISLYAAALDPRINAAVVSGYFGPRERMWEEPIYRNLFGILREFGDAGIARLIAPRALHIEHERVPAVAGPPPERPGRAGAAPAALHRFEFKTSAPKSIAPARLPGRTVRESSFTSEQRAPKLDHSMRQHCWHSCAVCRARLHNCCPQERSRLIAERILIHGSGRSDRCDRWNR